jgi:hypothetical protein
MVRRAGSKFSVSLLTFNYYFRLPSQDARVLFAALKYLNRQALGTEAGSYWQNLRTRSSNRPSRTNSTRSKKLSSGKLDRPLEQRIDTGIEDAFERTLMEVCGYAVFKRVIVAQRILDV